MKWTWKSALITSVILIGSIVIAALIIHVFEYKNFAKLLSENGVDDQSIQTKQ